MGPYNGDLSLPLSVQLVGGAGIIRFAPAGYKCQITYWNVKTDTNVLEGVCTIYKGYIGGRIIDQTRTGSSGDTSDVVTDLNDGDPVFIQWVGADASTTGRLTISGTQDVSGGGFRAF